MLEPDTAHGRVYRALVAAGSADLDELAGCARMDPDAVRAVLDELCAADVARAAGGTWTATSPERTVAAVLVAEERRRSRMWELAGALDALHGRSARSCAAAVEVGTDAELVEWVDRVQRHAEREVRWLDRPPHPGGAARLADQERLQVARMSAGVRYRVVHDQRVTTDPDRLAATGRLVDWGEQARVLAALPVGLLLADDRMGLLVPEPGHGGALLLHPSSMLTAFTGVFESLWRLAVPLSPAGAVTAEDRSILSLMASGVPDEAIARRLALSRRTVVRRVAALFERLGATSRFQAGVQAAHRGWL
ncbi:helix-turn-helix transcriptional regulator [Actinokineospora bangkokensis]|uniref:helix-turn-helix transcriptional regulator n=1 Tax=Actinokineospora bangkokensis TaxID=1193682 RepID=UPI000A8039D6|nr:helix-turn-helix transcriptional regulator [Actinokineospora bangkokensis]